VSGPLGRHLPLPAEWAMTTMAERFSPELALVDPDLASALRNSLPDAEDCLVRSDEDADIVREPTIAVSPAPEEPLAPARLVPAASPAPVASAEMHAKVEPEGLRSGRPRLRLRRWALAVVALGILAVPFLAFRSPDFPSKPAGTPPGRANTEKALGHVAGPSTGSASGRKVETAADTRYRVLDWPKVRDADLYNVVFVSGGKRVDRWVKGTFTKVPLSVSGGKGARRLVVYRWYVYPLYRGRQGIRFGKLLAQGAIRVPKGALGS
jgi:hypothetical protein